MRFPDENSFVDNRRNQALLFFKSEGLVELMNIHSGHPEMASLWRMVLGSLDREGLRT